MSYRLVAACLAAALACGHEPAPSPAPSPTPPDTGSPPPSNPPPSNPPPANPSPGNPPPANPPPGNPPPANPSPGDASVTIRRIDPAPECDGLLPASAPAAVRVHVDEPDGGCGPGVSEGGGHVAIARHFFHSGVDYQVFSPDGKPENRFSTAPGLVSCSQDSRCGTVLAQSDGFQAARLRGGNTLADPLLAEVLTLAADGSVRRVEKPTTPEMGIVVWWGLGEDPRGGSLLVVMAVTPPSSPPVAPNGKPCNAHDFRFGADGAERGRANLNCSLVAGGVSTAGETLLLEGADAVHGTFPFDTLLQWQEADGTSAGSPAAESLRIATRPDLAPLLDGSLAMNDGGTWTRVFPRLGKASAPAPEWLASRNGWRFRFTRGNRGYAFFPPPGQQLADCDPGLEIRAPSGRLCGTITFREEGGACTTATLDQGWDGTVVQQSARDQCSYRWWPRLLAGG